MNINLNFKIMLKILSILCYVFALLDFCLFYIVDVDLTGVSWSPYVAGCLGALFSWLDKKGSKEEENQ